ncbi:MAG: putative lipid II flippase FtsW [Patescibacteria group bacterium]|nr:putative lipid II flippase FtsW [Patescibacteria group bacterium]
MKPNKPDYILIFAIFTLVAFGLIILSSASAVISQDAFGGNYHYLKHQLLYGLPIGLLGFFICQRINYKVWKKLSFILIIISTILLALVFIPKLGYSYGGAKRWIIWGSFSIQPFEFIKLAFIIYLTALLSKGGEANKVIKQSLVPVLSIFIIIVTILCLQPNISALIMIFSIAILIYFLAGLNIFYIFSIIGVFFVGLLLLIKTTSYRLNRLTVFLHPETDPQGIGYQINQALLAIGSGGLFGLGLGHSIQKWKYLPEVIGDSVFAIVAEELGLAGAGFLVLLFIVLAWRGFIIAKNSSDKFGYLLAGGITGWIFFQAFINIAAISRIIPLTGITLPFVSYGGSSLIVCLTAVGILVNISKYSK